MTFELKHKSVSERTLIFPLVMPSLVAGIYGLLTIVCETYFHHAHHLSDIQDNPASTLAISLVASGMTL